MILVRFSILFTLAFLSSNAIKWSVHSFYECKTTLDTGLKVSSSFPIGAAVKKIPLQRNQEYRRTITREFNSITLENAMKFGALHPSNNVYRWDDADYIVNFALKEHIRVHGHTLIWARVNPPWINSFKGNKKEWEAVLKAHIQTVIKHFNGRVKSWDVVNEAFDDQGLYKRNVWLQNLGIRYLELCFKYAHEADPSALLFYNDYGHEYSIKKTEAILRLVKDFKQRGIPIHGLGLQMHTVVRISDTKIKRAIQSAASTGLLIHISELEVAINYQKGITFKPDTALLKAQAQKYASIVKIYKSIPIAQQFGITTWNVGDKDSWKNSRVANRDHPLLFNYEYKPKPAYYAFKKAAAD